MKPLILISMTNSEQTNPSTPMHLLCFTSPLHCHNGEIADEQSRILFLRFSIESTHRDDYESHYSRGEDRPEQTNMRVSERSRYVCGYCVQWMFIMMWDQRAVMLMKILARAFDCVNKERERESY